MIDKDKIAAQFAKLSRAYAALGDEMTTLSRMLDEQPTEGQLAKRFLDYYVLAWQAKYKAKMVVNGGRDMAKLKATLAVVPYDDLAYRARRFLASDDPFYVAARHPLAMCLASVNKFGSVATRPEDDDTFLQAAPADCRHTPVCRDDAAHTKRRAKDLQA